MNRLTERLNQSALNLNSIESRLSTFFDFLCIIPHQNKRKTHS